jgi:UDP-2,4-diacetamido-2,4,6-trideoxy-beta-L-altropyranose hydrolase
LRVFFRCDSGQYIGSGHLSRCLILANHLAKYGYRIEFISRNHEGNFNHLILNNNFKLNQLILKKSIVNNKKSSHKSWLGASVEEDVEDTLERIKDSDSALLIVDHYAIDERWEKLVKNSVKKIIVIDDLADRKHFCDILIDNNYVESFQSRYKNLTNHDCIQLLGPNYSFINPSFIPYKKNESNCVKEVKNILIYMGGGDVNGITLNLLNFFISNYDYKVTAVSSDPKSIKSKIPKNKQSNIEILPYQKDLSKLFSSSDMIVGGGGVAVWERLFLAVPSVIISVADNQLPACEYLKKQGVINYYGHFTNFNDKSFRKFFDHALNFYSKSTVGKWKDLIDGNGLNRLTKIINEKEFCKNITLVSEAYLTKGTNKIYLEINNLKVGSISHSVNKNVVNYSYKLIKGFKKSATFSNLIFFKLSERYNNIFKKGNSLYYSQSTGKKRYKVSLLIDKNSWINEYIGDLITFLLKNSCSVSLVHNQNDLSIGDYCFLLGCSQFVKSSVKKKFKKILVVHESDLPKGRGWSPLTWEILNNNDKFVVSLIEINDCIDAGNIFIKKSFTLKGNELNYQWKKIQAKYSFMVIRDFLLLKNKNVFIRQQGNVSYYKQRKPEDSELNINLPIIDQFNLLRVVDNESYPAFFKFKNSKFVLKIKNDDE